MLHAIEMGSFIMNKYYSKTDESPVYAAALLLDPSRRAAYLKKNWQSDWYETALVSARTIWEEEYKDFIVDTGPVVLQEVPLLMPLGNYLSELMDDLNPEAEDIDDTSTIDNFDAFVQAHPIRLRAMGITPLEWWCLQATRDKYPRLSRMAIALLSIVRNQQSQNVPFQVLGGHVHGIDLALPVLPLKQLNAWVAGYEKVISGLEVRVDWVYRLKRRILTPMS
jgi:hypothetical protein